MILSVVIVFSKLLLVHVFLFLPTSLFPLFLSNTKPIETTGRPRGTQRRSRINTSSPTSDAETGAGDNRPTKQRRTDPAAVVEQNTTEGNTRDRRQRGTPPTVEPNKSRGSTRCRIRRRLATADGETGTTAEKARPKGQSRKNVFERDLTPAERAIPDTPLLNNLGYHLSAYARVGRVRHIAICSFLSLLCLSEVEA